ncbi:hypothetical protein Tco_1110250 [Tanacetum coccineum]|uniref:Uncharacterized protein n=1 Tax=Tanacetum coccineum TaxID=301880 RepID=A0ABQ5IKN8_9ASTR
MFFKTMSTNALALNSNMQPVFKNDEALRQKDGLFLTRDQVLLGHGFVISEHRRPNGCDQLPVLITGASQSRQHVGTSLIHIESRKPPTKSLFDVDSSRISIVIVNTKEHHPDVLAVPLAFYFATEGLCFALGTECGSLSPMLFVLLLDRTSTVVTFPLSLVASANSERMTLKSLADPQVSTLSRQISTSYSKALTLVTKISRSTLSHLISGITFLVPLNIDTVSTKSLTGAAMTEVSRMTTSGDGGSTVGGGNGSGDSGSSYVVRKRYRKWRCGPSIC